ncbi:MAG: condensation domain-containing protein [Micromonosporaceae bacterium]
MREIPASVGQRLLSLMDHYRGQESTLNEQILWRIPASCDVETLTGAVAALCERHEALRTTFRSRGPRFTQIVHPPAPIVLHRFDTSAAADPVAAAREILGQEIRTPIGADSAVRASLIELGGQRRLFALTMHHLVTDDWSNALLSRDIRALCNGGVLPPVQWQYADWSQWQQGALDTSRDRLIDYWQDKLAGASLPALPAAADTVRGDGEPPWVSAEYPVDADVTRALRRLARKHRTTLFPVVLAIFYVLLGRHTGQSDLTVATLLANRGRPEVRDTVGFFISMVLLRCQLDVSAPFAELVSRARSTVMDAMRHQDLPYQLLSPGTVAGYGRADDVVFQLLGSFLTRDDMEGEELDDMDAQLERRRFALEFVLVPRGEGLTALLMCDRDRFDHRWAERFVRDYAALAGAVAGDPELTPHTLLTRPTSGQGTRG